jgi:glucose/arabinose dehydrogenase
MRTAALWAALIPLSIAAAEVQWTVVKNEIGPITSIRFSGADESELIVTQKTGQVFALDAYGKPNQAAQELYDFRRGLADFCNVRADGLMNAILDRAANVTYLYAYASFDCKDEAKRHYRLYRFRLEDRKLLDPVLVVDRLPYGVHHPAGAMLIEGAHLYLSTSDAQQQGIDRVQFMNAPQGKILRIPLERLRGARTPIAFDRSWVIACGLRDTHGLGIARHGGKTVLLATDHGPTGQGPNVPKELEHEKGLVARDELNVIPLDPRTVVNLGWPIVAALDAVNLSTAGDCPRKAVQPPKYIWGPDGTQEGIAPSGLAVFQSSDPSHPWNGHVFVAALKAKSIRHLFVDRAGDILGEAVRFPHGKEDGKQGAEPHPYIDKRKRAIACNSRGDCFFGTSDGDKSSGCTNCRDDAIVRFWLRR